MMNKFKLIAILLLTSSASIVIMSAIQIVTAIILVGLFTLAIVTTHKFYNSHQNGANKKDK